MKIRVTDNKGCEEYFTVGDIAVVIRVDKDGDVLADFNSQGNPSIYESGVWWVGKPDVDFEVIDES